VRIAPGIVAAGWAQRRIIQKTALTLIPSKSQGISMQTNDADTILNIAVTGPVIRIDLGTLLPQGAGADGKPQLEARMTQQLVMPLEGFVRSMGMQEQVIRKLLADGVLKATSTAAAVEVGTP
jgi:hypothetical protein